MVVEADALTLPFADESFDAVTSSYVLDLMPIEVGGCRPVRLAHIVKAAGFSTPRRTVVQHALPSEILVAIKRTAERPERSAVRSAPVMAEGV